MLHLHVFESIAFALVWERSGNVLLYIIKVYHITPYRQPAPRQLAGGTVGRKKILCPTAVNPSIVKIIDTYAYTPSILHPSNPLVQQKEYWLHVL